MGFYINPPADGFAEILKDGLYVDKSELIAYTNQVLGTSKKLTCFSRPRRFGKSFATKMLVAYYSRGADARALFENLKIAGMKDAGFEKHLNQYHVLSLDITSFISVTQNVDNTVLALQKDVIEELAEAFPGCIKPDTTSLFKALSQVNARTGEKFFIIIDEWDALFREAKNNRRLQESYLQLLRSLFKSNQTSQVILGAYMTGILPIKKYGTQSALTDFYEFTMLEPGPLAQFAGFTESEVRSLCQKHDLDFEKAQSWYDGYHFPGMEHIYNPNSIIKAIFHHKFGNYWTQTETYESLKIYIDLNQDGLRDSIVEMLGKKHCRIDIGTFQNDMTSLKNRDDIFTLLVHLGYLAYESDSRSVFIPNEEIREEFIRAVRNGSRKELIKIIEQSDRLLDATLKMDSQTVAEILEEVHNANTTPHFYNNEQALRSVVIMAYLSSVDHYFKFEELASGKGYSDILFLPNHTSTLPALLIELKWNHSAREAVSQIKKQNYIQFSNQFGYNGEILLIGINYSTKTKKHTCKIEKVT